MHFEAISTSLHAIAKNKSVEQALIVPVPAAYTTSKSKAVKATDKTSALGKLLSQAVRNKHFSGASKQILSVYCPAEISATHVIFVGCGSANPSAVKAALTLAVSDAKSKKARTCTIALHLLLPHTALVPTLYAGVMGASEPLYNYTLTKPSATAVSIQKVLWALPEKTQIPVEWDQSLATAQGVAFAREWGNRPANHATPTDLAKAALDLAKRHTNIKCKVLERKDIERLGMGAFLAVAQGSEQAPKFIELSYTGAKKAQAPTALIGKGITFDTGGISLKPAPDMDEMKFDMCGAASVLGVFEALGAHQPKTNVIGLIPTCENMPSGKAIKPGDVVTSMSGQTIEVLNTDAEGRLILCDALHYARKFKPRATIDIATLTGACIIALGHVRAALYSNDDTLAADLSNAAEAALDPCWRMPLDDIYAQGLESNFADMANIAGRPGGSITAAKFLQKYVGDMQWAHLDIAGVAFGTGKNKGSTGRPVPLLFKYLLNLA